MGFFSFGKDKDPSKKGIPPRRSNKPKGTNPRNTTQTHKGNRKPPQGGNKK